MFNDVIDLLLQKKATISAEKARRIDEAMLEIDEEFAQRSVQIDNLLRECGYIEPVEESDEEIIDGEDTAEVTEDTANGITIY